MAGRLRSRSGPYGTSGVTEEPLPSVVDVTSITG